MKKLKSLVKLIAFIKLIKPKRRRRRIKLMPLLNPKRAGKVAYHAGRIRVRNEIKKLYWYYKNTLLEEAKRVSLCKKELSTWLSSFFYC